MVKMGFGAMAQLFQVVLAISLALAAAPSTAQDAFDIAARVNDGVVTNFEVAQRQRLLTVLRQPGVTREGVIDELIDDRLRIWAATAAGITPTDEEIRTGVEEFASRANMAGEEFLQALGEVGIEPETIQEYLRVQLAWGDLIRTRFSTQARPSDTEIDRAMKLGTETGSARVLLAEIFLPTAPEVAAISEERAGAIQQMHSYAEFEEAARQFSVAPTRANGGQLNWMPLSELPPQLGPLFLTMTPGEVTAPIILDGAVALFQFRGLQDVMPPADGSGTVEYARVNFAPGTDITAERARIMARADGCDDLYGIYLGAGSDQLMRQTVPVAQIPAGIRQPLSRLDPGETATVANAGGGGSIVMLCARTPAQRVELDRDQVAQALFSRRLNSYAEGYLAELRADAHIEKS
jgi:peptidyl-prolyl cis-trans isomerase SurA